MVVFEIKELTIIRIATVASMYSILPVFIIPCIYIHVTLHLLSQYFGHIENRFNSNAQLWPKAPFLLSYVKLFMKALKKLKEVPGFSPTSEKIFVSLSLFASQLNMQIHLLAD